MLFILKAIKFFLSPLFSYVSFVRNKMEYRGLLSFPYGVKIGRNSLFEGCNSISSYSSFSGKMGYGSYISDNCSIEGEIGRFCSIAPNVSCNRGIHPISYPYATTSPMFFSLKRQNGFTYASKQTFNEMTHPIIIGNDCWICSNVFICGGVRIGDGAVVYAGAVVTKDVPPYAIVAGVPARIIKYRYDDNTIDFLLQYKWWNKPIEWLKKNWALLNDIDKLKEYASLHKESQATEG